MVSGLRIPSLGRSSFEELPMSPGATLVIGFASVPVLAMAAGGLVAAFWPPSAKVRSYIQHLAAGVVFSAVAVEVLPDVVHRRAPVAASIGFAAGVALMLAIAAGARRLEGAGTGEGGGVPARRGGTWRLAAVVGVDVFIDGLLVGLRLRAQERAGPLVAAALAVELLALGLATAAALGASGARAGRVLGTIAALAVLPAAGAAAGFLGAAGLRGDWLEAVLAFAAAALLYLVTEELLVEAHEVPETPLATACFFAGFLALLLADMAATPA
jgi:ZIP family zinc transporter